jgi:hypothetical protein
VFNQPLFQRLLLVETVLVLWGTVLSFLQGAAPVNRVRWERNGLSVTDSYHGWSDDEMKVGVLCVEYKSTNAYSLS